MGHLTKSTLGSIAILACSCLLGISQAVAESSVWSVRYGDNTIYLGGTVHLLRPVTIHCRQSLSRPIKQARSYSLRLTLVL